MNIKKFAKEHKVEFIVCGTCVAIGIAASIIYKVNFCKVTGLTIEEGGDGFINILLTNKNGKTIGKFVNKTDELLETVAVNGYGAGHRFEILNDTDVVLSAEEYENIFKLLDKAKINIEDRDELLYNVIFGD